MDTIAAIASPPGPAERGIVRLSGPRASELLCAALVSRPELARRRSFTARLDDGRGSQPALVLWMPGPDSYTGEDVAELHLPGSPPLLEAALSRLLSLGARQAEPGEFTRRAFEHGRMDLARAEGVLALVEAASEEAARAAGGLLFGGLSGCVEELREGLVEVRALCEASLDFDESDTGHVDERTIVELVEVARERVGRALDFEERREPLSGLPRLALVGAPNAGKSTLFNRLTGGRALVSELAGTTRDGAAGIWRVAGFDCELLDMPGLDAELAAGSGAAERRAQELGRELARAADLRLWVVDASAPEPTRAEPQVEGPGLTVLAKLDLLRGAGEPAGLGPGAVGVSAHTGRGLDALERRVGELLGLSGGGERGGTGLARELSLRHRRALRASARALDRALLDLAAGAPLDQTAQDLREATEALDELTGRTRPEDLLDRIFARFCLGK